LINPSRTSLKIVAVVLGIFIAGAQFVLFSVWLSRQADDEAKNTSAWALGSSELQLGQAIAVLQDLAAQGVDSCRPGHVDAMRQAALRTGPVKQIVLLGLNDEVLCTDPRARASCVMKCSPQWRLPGPTLCWT
jgi:sensor c-di-GMP phosphodiesterase-like protein